MRLRAPSAIITLLGLFALCVLGCQPKEIMGGKRPEKFYRTIVSLSPSTTELLGAYAWMSTLKGRTKSCNYPLNVDTIEVVCDVKPNYERIAELKPDAIFYDASLFNESDVQKLKELGFELRPLTTGTLDEYMDFLYRTGNDLVSGSKFSEYADKVYAAKQIALGNQPNPKPRTALLIGAEAGGEFMVAGKKSFQAELTTIAGGEVVGPDSARFEVGNAETLVAENPEVIIVAGKADGILADPRFRSISAVKSKRVVGIDSEVMLRAGARVDQLITSLSQVLHLEPGGDSN